MSLLSVPLKTVIMISANAANEALPDGYVPCDGATITNPNNADATTWLQDINPGANATFVTPNLNNRYVIGADRTKVVANAGGTADLASDAPGPKGVLGSQVKTLIAAEMPSHWHIATALTNGNHDHGGSTSTSVDGAHGHGSGCHANFVTTVAGTPHGGFGGVDRTTEYSNTQGQLSWAGDHSHSGGSDVQGAHTHTITINAIGSGGSFDMRPRYLGVVFAIKVKK